jgi:hypothetical protein
VGLRISYPVRRNHSFGVCALGRFGTTIRLSLSRAPLVPPPRNGDPAFLLPAPAVLALSDRFAAVFAN